MIKRAIIIWVCWAFAILALAAPAHAQKVTKCDEAGAGIKSSTKSALAFREGVQIFPDSKPGVASGGACARIDDSVASVSDPDGALLAVFENTANNTFALLSYTMGSPGTSHTSQCVGGGCSSSTGCQASSLCTWEINAPGYKGTAKTTSEFVTQITLDTDSFSAPEAQGTLGVANSGGTSFNFVQQQAGFFGAPDPVTGSITQSIILLNSGVGAPDTWDAIYFDEASSFEFTGPDADAFQIVSFPAFPRIEEVRTPSNFFGFNFDRPILPALPVGSQMPVEIAFTPTSNRRYDATLTIKTDARNTDAFPVTLIGLGEGFAPSNPGTMTMSVVEPAGAAGQDRTLRYEITAPAASLDLDVIEFEHDVAFFAPGLTVDTASLPTEPCGVGSNITAISPSFFNFRGGQLASGDSCSFDVKIKVPENTDPQSYRQQTGPLRSTIDGAVISSAAAVTQLEITQGPIAPALTLAFNPQPAPANATTQLTYTFTAPDNALPVSDISIDHDIAFNQPHLSFQTATAPSEPCGAGSSLNFTSPNFVQLRGGSLPTGGTCEFSLNVIVPKDTPSADYQVLTSPVDAKSGTSGIAVTSPAASTSLTVIAAEPVKPIQMSAVITTSPLLGGQESDYVVSITNPNSLTDGVDITGRVVLNTGTRVPGLNFESVSFTGTGCSAALTPETDSSGPETIGVNLASGTIPANRTCTLSLKVRPDVSTPVGTYPVFGLIQGSFDGNSASAQFTNLPLIVITDDNTPVLSLPANIDVNTDAGKSTAQVTFTISATDTEDGALTPLVTSSPTAGLTSGSDFPLGVTTLTVSATDSASNKAEDSFTVTVSDGEAPIITNVPPTQTLATTAGANIASLDVTTLGVSVTDNVDTGLSPLFSIGGAAISGPYDFSIGDNTVLIDAQDAAGNKAAQQSFVVSVEAVASVDTDPPVLSLPANIDVNTDAGKSTAQVTFTISATDTEDGALTPLVTSSPATGLISGSDFPLGVTTLTVSATDSAGNKAEDSFTVTVSDTEKPIISVPEDVTIAADPESQTAIVQFNVSATDNVDGALIPIITSSPTTGLVSGSSFPLGETVMTVQATDNVGNSAEASFTISVEDRTHPTLEISGVPNTVSGPFTVTFTFSEIVTGFEAADIVVTNGSVSDFQTVEKTQSSAQANSLKAKSMESDRFTALITPDQGGELTITIPANAVEDLSGNSFQANITVQTIADMAAPTVTLSDPGADVRAAFQIMASFNEDVSGFALDDVMVSNATKLNLQAFNSREYAIRFEPLQAGEITISIPENVASDAAGNGNKASNIVTTIYIDEAAVRARTQRIINNFIVRRADQITSNEPDLAQRLLRRTDGGGQLNGQADHGGANISFAATATAKDTKLESVLGAEHADRIGFWTNATLSSLSQETADQDFFLAHMGVDYRLGENSVIGFIGQYDWANEEDQDQGYAVRGKGWMAGPYFAARAADNLILDGRVAWGQSSNEIRPDLTYMDKFKTNRFLVKAQATGDFMIDEWQLNPALSVLYFEETQKSYTNTLQILIPRQTISFGRMTFGPEVSKSFQGNKIKAIRPHISVKGIWNFDDAKIVNILSGTARGTDVLRARIEGGVGLTLNDGTGLGLDGYYDGIGVNAYEAFGATAKLRLSFE